MAENSLPLKNTSHPRVWISSAEFSGDLIAVSLISLLRSRWPLMELKGMGGSLSQSAGLAIDPTLNASMGTMGVGDVLKNISALKATISAISQAIVAFDPDLVICIDSPSLHIRIAKKTRPSTRAKWVQYCAPKLWAWGGWRAEKYKEYMTELWGILPFEESFFKVKALPYYYVGSPLIQRLPPPTSQEGLRRIMILPGSRRKEIERILPFIVDVVCAFEDSSVAWMVSQSESLQKAVYDQVLDSLDSEKKRVFLEKITWFQGPTESLYLEIQKSRAALVTSGTISLECALLKVPHIVIYRTDFLTWILAKILLKARFISLPNLSLNRQVVPECVQFLSLPVILKLLRSLLDKKSLLRDRQLSDFKEIHTMYKSSHHSILSRMEALFKGRFK